MDGGVVFVVAVSVILFIVFALGRRGAREGGGIGRKTAGRRAEALFVSMFPELQPHFHPERVIEFVRARQAKTPAREGRTVRNPKGFEAAAAEVRFDGEDRELWRLLDAAGAVLAQFRYEDHREGAALRVGQGKITVTLQDRARPRVRYWHPEREFKWQERVWIFQTRMSESSFESSSESSSTSTGSSSSAATAVAATAGIVAAGGAFDGGGASQSWTAVGDDDSSSSTSSDLATTAY